MTPRVFLSDIFDHARGHYLEFRCLDRASGKMHCAFFHRESDVPRFLGRHVHCDHFVGVLPRASRSGRSDSIRRFSWLYADIDFGDSHASAEHRDETSARAALARLSMRPTWLVRTRSGFHAWYKIKTAVDLARWQNAMSRLRLALGGDPNALDAARVLRVPGTHCYKVSPPAFVHLAGGDPSRIYEVDRFLALPAPVQLPLPRPKPRPRPAPQPVMEPNIRSRWERANDVPILRVLESLGVRPIRHGRTYASVCPVHGSGHNDRQFVLGTTSNVGRCFGDCDRTFSPIDLMSSHCKVDLSEAIERLLMLELECEVAS